MKMIRTGGASLSVAVSQSVSLFAEGRQDRQAGRQAPTLTLAGGLARLGAPLSFPLLGRYDGT